MGRTALVNGVVISGGMRRRGCTVVLNGTKIERLDDSGTPPPPDAEVIDLEGCFLTAGFIDIIANGAGGSIFGTFPETDSLRDMEEAQLAEGTTGFLASAPTNTPGFYQTLLTKAAAYRPHAVGNYWGLHLEGPFLNTECKGAHPASCIHKASMEEVRRLLELGRGEVRMMTIAPELQDREVIDFLDRQGVALSVSHSAASYEDAWSFLTSGNRAVTHLYNGMHPIHHRNPGLIPAIFRAKPFTGIIADGIHVAFPLVRMAYDALGSEAMMLVTDRFTACSKPSCIYLDRGDHFGTILPNGEEVLSGSALSMLKAVRNCVEQVGIALEEAVNMASHVPARALGVGRQVGLVKEGYRADLVAFDRDYAVKRVFLNGVPMIGHTDTQRP